MDEEIHAAELCPCGYGRSAGVERDNLVCLQRKRVARAGIRAVARLPGHAPGHPRRKRCRPAPRRTGRRRLNRSRNGSFSLGVAPLPLPPGRTMAKTRLDPKFLPLVEGRRIASLGTLNDDGSVHLTAVWYLYEDGSFFVATSSRSRKARNLAARPRATLMVESRKPGSERGVTASGPVEIIPGEKARQLNARLYRRSLRAVVLACPPVGPVFAAVGDITVKLKPTLWTRSEEHTSEL